MRSGGWGEGGVNAHYFLSEIQMQDGGDLQILDTHRIKIIRQNLSYLLSFARN